MNEGIIRVDLKRMMTRIMKALEFKTDPNMRQELLAAFEEDIKAIISKYDNKYEIFEAEDHEVGMAMGQLDAIHNAASELEEKIGNEEKDLPAWIQSHITSAYEYLKQANDNFHELEEANFYSMEPGNIGGMGPISLPGVDNELGSGDIPAGVGSAKDRYEEELKKKKKKNKKKKSVLEFKDYLNEFHQIKPFEPEVPKGERLGDDDYEKGPANDPDAEMKERQKALKKAKQVVSFRDFNSF